MLQTPSEKEQLFENLGENSPLGVLVTGNSGMVYINRQLANMTGFAEELLQGIIMLHDLFLTEEEQAEFEKNTKEILSGRKQNEASRFTLRTKEDGWLRLKTYSWLLYQNGENFCITTVEDITKQNKALEDSEKKFKKERLLSEIYNIALQKFSTSDKLKKILEKIISSQELNLLPRGLLLIKNIDSKDFKIAAHSGIPQNTLDQIKNIPADHFLPNLAADENRIFFADPANRNLTVTLTGEVTAREYLIPVIYKRDLVGVLNLFLPRGEESNESDQNFLDSAAGVIATILNQCDAD